MKSLLEVLRRDTETTDWDIAIWFPSPNSWLSGQLPKSLLSSAQDESAARLVRAAEQEVVAEDDAA